MRRTCRRNLRLAGDFDTLGTTMNDEVIRDIAEKLAHQQLQASWPYLLAMLAVSVVVGAVAIYSSTYLRKRAETFASKSDLNEVLLQIRATTAATEEVKSSIAHADWASREQKTIQRTKLEDLLLAIYDLRIWEKNARDFHVHSRGSNPGPSPIGKISLLATLYFPELLLETKKLTQIHYKFHLNQLETEASIRSAAGDESRVAQYLAASSMRSKELHGEHLILVEEIEKISETLMRSIIGS